jgi:sensor histidine kinase regulating citrate/malate metabolism
MCDYFLQKIEDEKNIEETIKYYSGPLQILVKNYMIKKCKYEELHRNLKKFNKYLNDLKHLKHGYENKISMIRDKICTLDKELDEELIIMKNKKNENGKIKNN